MKRTLLIGIFCLLLPVQPAYAVEKTRLIIMADMGNEPDEEQQMMHMLMYSNMFDLEGLIACSGKYLHDGRDGFKGKVHPELFHELIDGYETGSRQPEETRFRAGPSRSTCEALSRPVPPNTDSQLSQKAIPPMPPG